MNTAKTYSVRGMHCASCAAIIEKTLKKTGGVKSVSVNYGTETATIDIDQSKTNYSDLSKKIEPLGYSLVNEEGHAHHMESVNMSKQEKLADIADMKWKVISIIPLAVISIIVMGWDILGQFGTVSTMPSVWEEFFHHLLPVMATYSLFVVGKPYLMGFLRFIRYGKANMDTLIGIGTGAAFVYSFVVSAFEESLRPFINVDHTYYDVVIVVIAFITLGKYLEAVSKLKTGDAIEQLLTLQAKTALVIRDGKETEIPINEVMRGDLIVVKPAGKIPVDGEVVDGSSYVDEAMVTGEPIPVRKKTGDTVVAGTINTDGSFTFKATKVGEETLLSHIIRMVKEAQGSKAPIQALADKISGVFVPTVIVLSLVSLGAWLVFGTHFLGFSQALSYGLVSFVGILVIACPCALGLATPTAIIVGVGKGAKEGILVKDAATLEKLGKVDTVVVDKTGTITRGKPELTSFENMSDMTDDKLIGILASLEQKSEHPIARAVTSHAQNVGIPIVPVRNFLSIKGKGLKGIVDDTEYYAGNTALVADLKISFDTRSIETHTNEGKTPVVLATKDAVLAVAMVSDAIKPEAAKAIADLHAMHISVTMLTGDNADTARYIARQAGIDHVIAEVMPDDKLNTIKELQSQGHVVLMAGDGVNDAPALAQADVGIAMATGTDVAIESAGITLLHGDISKLVKAIRLSKLTMRGIRQNLFWAFIYNIIGIPLAGGAFYPLFGLLLNPVFAGLAMAMSSVSVVANSLRLKAKSLSTI